MLRLCDIREKIVDKVKAIKNHRKNSGFDFYYIYNGTEKNGDERTKNFKLYHPKQDLISNHQNKTLGTSKIRKSIGDTPTVSVYP